jgi:hypothetical protein
MAYLLAAIWWNPPIVCDAISSPRHFCHYEAMIVEQHGIVVLENVVYRRVFFPPPVAPQGTAFSVLAE